MMKIVLKTMKFLFKTMNSALKTMNFAQFAAELTGPWSDEVVLVVYDISKNHGVDPLTKAFSYCHPGVKLPVM